MASTPKATNGVLPSPPSSQQSAPPPLSLPQTSLSDSGNAKRPRDARLLHVILANQGVSAYQERVPLQLLDYAYRYTSSVLNDAVHLTQEGYGQPPMGRGANAQDQANVTMQQLRLSISTRQTAQLPHTLPKEYLLEAAQEKNKVALPSVPKQAGIALPPEKYCLTGVGWGLAEEWESEAEEDDDPSASADKTGDDKMEEDEDGEDEEGGRMEDVFGENEDKDMPDA